ncbi:MAG: succinate dehydrogenase, hydrophobic membrane anchor protein [Pelagibacteraceae bacterium TMED216]|nr:MAG: succinate dehydrogenase, hydrophobic membrane anchor protein [Pelagibacteraceae bacterium TMED216]
MHISTKKWLFIKLSSAILIPLLIWFVLNFVSIIDNNYQEVINLIASQPFKIILSCFLIVAFFFYSLTISEIFEDYIDDEKIKNVANKLTYFFAIIISIITILTIYNF